jgi:hypothetical protein
MKLTFVLLSLMLIGGDLFADKMPEKDLPKGVIGRAIIGGLPVIYKFVNEAPTDAKRKALPWVTVISWKYDGEDNNGMPPKHVNERMGALEEALQAGVVKSDFCEHAISRTGSNLKELIYYIHDRDKFMEKLNEALAKHDAYPIQIEFFNDPDWKEFETTRADFNKKKGEDGGGNGG